MISDFESLYMIRKGCNDSLMNLMNRFDSLFWKTSFQQYYLSRPEGIEIEDLLQEARLGFLEAIYTFQERKKVGLAHYIKVCVESRVKTRIRKCSSMAYRLIDTNFSLDMFISEDQSLALIDVVQDKYRFRNPQYVALLEESRQVLQLVLNDLKPIEQEVYEMWAEGYTYREIANKLEIGEKQVDNTIQKIKRLILGQKPMS